MTFLSSTSVIYAQKVNSKYILFHDVIADTLRDDVSKVLIVGMGSYATRIFLDKLATEFVDKFKKTKLRFEYKYFSNNYSESIKQLQVFPDSSFDAYLFFSPSDSSKFYGIVVQSEPYSNPSDAIYYHQNFAVSFYSNSNKRDPVWQALLNVNGDINEKRLYLMITDYIYRNFKANKYFKPY